MDLSGTSSINRSRYFQSVGALETSGESEETPGEGFGRVSLPGIQGNTVEQDKELIVSTVMKIDRETSGFSLYCIWEDMYGRQLIHLREESPQLGVKQIIPGTYHIRVTFPPLWLNPGLYALHFKVQLWGHRASSRHVSDKFPLDVSGISSMADSTLHPKVKWSFE